MIERDHSTTARRFAATACMWLSQIVAAASIVVWMIMADSKDQSCRSDGVSGLRCTTTHPAAGIAWLVLAAGIAAAVAFGALSKIAAGIPLDRGWPGWLGGLTLSGAVYGLLATGIRLGSDDAGASHLGPVTLNVASAAIAAIAVSLLALVAPFGGFRRTASLRLLLPFFGLVWAFPVIWESGIGLARLGSWNYLEQDATDDVYTQSD